MNFDFAFSAPGEYEKYVEYLTKRVPEEQPEKVYEMTRTKEDASKFFAEEHFGFECGSGICLGELGLEFLHLNST